MMKFDMESSFQFLVYVCDPRDVEQVKPIFEAALRCLFTPEAIDRRPDKRAHRFEATILGLHLLFSHHPRSRGQVLYRLAGGTAQQFEVPGMQKVSLDAHFVRILRSAGFKQVMLPSDFARWDRDDRAVKRPSVRSAEEAHLYLDAHPCPACGASGFERRSSIESINDTLVTVYEGACENCGAYRYFELQLDDPLPPLHTDEAIVLGTGESTALTAHEFTQAAERLASRIPIDTRQIDEAARGRAIYQLRLAIGALDEARKLSGGENADRLATRRAELASRLALVRTAR